MTLVVNIDTTATRAKLARLNFALQPYALMGWMEASVEPIIKSRMRDRFVKEGDDASGKWAPLKESTVAIRTGGEVDYGAGPIMHRTGQLEQFLTQAEGGYVTTGGDAIMTYPGESGNATIQAKIRAAQEGISRTPLEGGGMGGPTPARPVLALGVQDAAWIMTSLEAYIMGLS